MTYIQDDLKGLLGETLDGVFTDGESLYFKVGDTNYQKYIPVGD